MVAKRRAASLVPLLLFQPIPHATRQAPRVRQATGDLVVFYSATLFQDLSQFYISIGAAGSMWCTPSAISTYRERVCFLSLSPSHNTHPKHGRQQLFFASLSLSAFRVGHPHTPSVAAVHNHPRHSIFRLTLLLSLSTVPGRFLFLLFLLLFHRFLLSSLSFVARDSKNFAGSLLSRRPPCRLHFALHPLHLLLIPSRRCARTALLSISSIPPP